MRSICLASVPSPLPSDTWSHEASFYISISIEHFAKSLHLPSFNNLSFYAQLLKENLAKQLVVAMILYAITAAQSSSTNSLDALLITVNYW